MKITMLTFVKYAQSKNINVKLLTKETDSSIIEKYKLYFMDYGIIDEVKIIKKEDLDFLRKKIYITKQIQI